MDVAAVASPAVSDIEDAHDMIQIIDEDGGWVEGLGDKLGKWNFHNKGFDYWVVSILGCQSSGKSTLLNLLFGTKFQVMDSQRGRSQTTKGIWMGRSANTIRGRGTDTLVLDVEGTDGRERGEEQKSFERKSSLFSLALAEILIINLWFQDIGRWDAANYGLLKTVFELNLQLFGRHSSGSGSKTLLLFVIRDHVRAVTPLEPLTRAVESDLEKIWGGISKPSEFADSRVHDFFDIMYTSLSHKILDANTFAADAEALKHRFTDPDANDFIFKDAYAKDVPADGWALYAERIWETIQESKDLDLPTQKEMLAMFRCDELMETAYRSFAVAMEPVRQQLGSSEGSFVPAFGQHLHQAHSDALSQYETPASRYHADVAARKGAALKEKMLDAGYALFLQQMRKIYEAAVRHADELAKKLAPPSDAKEGSPGKQHQVSISDLPGLLDDLKKEATQYFESHAQASLVPGLVSWKYDSESQDIRDHIEALVKRLREQYVDHLLKRRQQRLRQDVMNQLNNQLDATAPDMWPRIADLHDHALEKARAKLRPRLMRLGFDDEELSAREQELEERAFAVVKDRLVEKSQHILYQMQKKFDETFRLDPEGLPRRWTKSDNIEETFKEARQLAYGVLDAYSIVRLRESDRRLSFFDASMDPACVDPSLVVISADQCSMARDTFKRESDPAFIEAKREQEREIAVRIPPFFWAVMLILGFNEIMALLGNPLLLFLFVVLGLMAYAAWLAGLLDVPVQIATQLWADLTGRAKSAAVQSVVGRFASGPAVSKDKRD
jgi:hypothetical protein